MRMYKVEENYYADYYFVGVPKLLGEEPTE